MPLCLEANLIVTGQSYYLADDDDDDNDDDDDGDDDDDFFRYHSLPSYPWYIRKYSAAPLVPDISPVFQQELMIRAVQYKGLQT